MTAELWQAYRLRWRRRGLLWRAFRKRHEVAAVADRTGRIAANAILCLSCVRNEAVRLPHWLAHHRRLGVEHFLIVDNDSTDGTGELLADQPDVSLWRTAHSYKAARFGVDWLTWLQMRHAHGHWCLIADADELLVYPYCETRDLQALTVWLEDNGNFALPAMMLDLYPQGALSGQGPCAGQDPLEVLGWFDAGNYTMTENPLLRNLWLQGGPRARAFFAADPRRAPTLSKTPLVRWNRRFVYVNSTHSLLPRRLNRVYDRTGGEAPSGVLLHTKFLPGVIDRAAEERLRGEHFHDSARYQDYYDRVTAGPDLWHPHAQRYAGWRQLEALGLLSRGGWV